MRSAPLRAALRWAPVLACLALLAAHLEVFAARVPYPYDLEWMEGGVLGHAWRLARGLPLFGPPSPDFVPFVYPPGYPALLAALGAVAGLSPALGRAVSLAGLALAASGLAFLVHRATARAGRPDVVAAAFAAAALVGTWQGVGAYYDLVRADALFLGLLAWSVALALEGGTAAAASAGLLLAASFTMKHNAAAWGLPLALVVAGRHGWRRALVFAACAAGPAGLLALRWELASEGRFTAYLLEVPAHHPLLASRLWPDLPARLGTTLPIPAALVAGWAWRRAAVHGALGAALPAVAGVLATWAGTWTPPEVAREVVEGADAVGFFAVSAGVVAVGTWACTGPDRRALALPALLGGGTAAVALPMWAHNGGYLNVLAPLYAAVVVGAALVLAALARAGHGGLVAALVAAHAAWVLGTLDPARLCPTAADVAAGDAVVDAIRGIDGPVFSPYAAWLPTYAGHPPSAHAMAIWDLDYPGGPFADDVRVIDEAVATHRWPAALSSNLDFHYGLDDAYPGTTEVLDPSDRSFLPKTGLGARPIRVRHPPAGQ